MATLLWIVIGVLLAVVWWIVPALAIVVPLILLAVVLVAILVPRSTTAAGAKVAIGFGGFLVVVFSPNVIRDPLGASGATYLLFGGGLLIAVLGLVGVARARVRQRVRASAVEADST